MNMESFYIYVWRLGFFVMVGRLFKIYFNDMIWVGCDGCSGEVIISGRGFWLGNL